MIACIRDMGDHPCPRCYVSKQDLDKAGSIHDHYFRIEKTRIPSTAIDKKVATARAALYNGSTLASVNVDKALKSKSLVPTIVSESNSFQ